MNTHDHHDDEPLPGEDELKALYRSLPRNEPTLALDEAVRRAAAAPFHTSSPRRMTHWPVAAASAAVLVLAAGLGWHMRDQVPAMQQAPAPAPAPGVSASTPTPAATEAPTIRIADDDASRLSVPAAAPAAPAAAATIAPHRTHESIRSAIRPKVVVPAAPAPAREMSATPEPVMAPTQAPPPPPAPAAPIAAAPAYMPMPAPAETPIGGHRAMTMKAVAAPPMPVTPAPMPAIDPTAASPTDSPAQELDKIRLLLTQQRRDEALQRLAAFQRAHPEVTLPDDLRAQLPDHD
jgi:hypothetical protein